jgi:hypothetical protein
MTTIYCVCAGDSITAVYGADISKVPYITAPDGYTSMSADDPRYASWYAALPADVQTGVPTPGPSEG